MTPIVSQPDHGPRARHSRLFSTFLSCVIALAGCAGGAKFNSPEAARDALVAALRSDDPRQLKDVLGPASTEIVSSGDDVADRQVRENFLQSYSEKHSLVRESPVRQTLQVGANDWPLPIPIVKSGNSWSFDTRAAKDEILNRRIGRNELSTIKSCLAVVDAQREYFSADRDGDSVLEYAQRFLSDPGHKNGLFWKTAEGEAPSPLGELAADAADEGYGGARSQESGPQPYHGYQYRILTAQGPDAPGGERSYLKNGNLTEGFAVVAWPAEYGNSGIMTFIVNHNGVVFERDLGSGTNRKAARMSSYNPDDHWNLSDVPEAED